MKLADEEDFGNRFLRTDLDYDCNHNLVLGGNGEPGSGTLWSTHGLAILPGIVTVTVVVVVVVVVIPNTVTL